MVRIQREPKEFDGSPLETCCFCGKPTPMWTKIYARKDTDQVACCEECASIYKASEVPTKEEWCLG